MTSIATTRLEPTTTVSGPPGVALDLFLHSATFVGLDGMGETVLVAPTQPTLSHFVPNVIVRITRDPVPEIRPDEHVITYYSWEIADTTYEEQLSRSPHPTDHIIQITSRITTPEAVVTFTASVHDDDYMDLADAITDLVCSAELVRRG